jgi:DNA mismatch endonuclease, patch repair protein
MRAIRRRDTAVELAIRSQLHARGYRFRVDHPVKVDGRSPKPDIVFSRRKVAVFIDGCFWHGCPEHGRTPKRNTHYWSPKIARNIERDRDQTLRLESAGWRVLRIWAHEDTDAAVDAIATALSGSASTG